MIAMSRKLFIVGLLITIVAIALGAIYFGFSRKENAMEQTHTEKTNIPPIDAAAPAHTQTATFAMG
jgi:flagellar basal body-associated protein FliL